MDVMIRVENLSKIYHRQRPDQMIALDNIDMTVARGEILGLTGPSGSGKTTLLSLLGCMARPTSGQVFLHDRPVSRLPERFLARIRRESFGFIFQQYHLLRDITVVENVMLPLYPGNDSFRKMKVAAGKALEYLGISGLQGKKVKELSGGEQQRVAIARALVADPEVVVADEPTAHLDGDLTLELLQIFSDLRRDGKTLIIASHDPLITTSSLINHLVSLRFGKIERDVRQ